MADIGKLNLKVGATTAGLSRDLAHAKDQIASFTEKAGSLFSKLGPLGLAGGITGALGLGGATNVFREQAAKLKEMKNAAAAVGMSYESLAGMMAFAGPAADALPRSLQHMTRELAQVRLGSEQAGIKFAQLGINMERLK